MSGECEALLDSAMLYAVQTNSFLQCLKCGRVIRARSLKSYKARILSLSFIGILIIGKLFNLLESLIPQEETRLTLLC